MVSKAILGFAFLCFLLSNLSKAIWAHPNVQIHPSFEFIKHLQGYKIGDKAEGVHKLKKYLHHFGYLNHYPNENHDYFDNNLDIAIKTYQLNFNLKPTGILDGETVSRMMMPRCGVPDIIGGKTRMHAAGSYNIKYAYFDGAPKWPYTRGYLNWALQPGTKTDVIGPIRDYVLKSWTGVAPFAYNFIGNSVSSADIKIGFANKSSRPGFVDGVLGYAYPPTDGTMYFNAGQKWSQGAVQGSYDLGTVGLHELGHILGLNHSSVEDAIMWPIINSGVIKGLHDDDYQGMKALYNIR